MQKDYAKQTVEDVYEKSRKLSNGCIICYSDTTIRVLYDGVPTYLIRAIFGFYGKPYNGKIVRTCGNRKCINPDHLYSPTKEEKFWSNVDIKGEDDCWEWKSLSGTVEYGNTRFNGKYYAIHRLAYKLSYGDFDETLLVCHHCDNPPCCNPKHLFLGTNQDNVDDRERKGRNKMPHSLGEDHGNSKLKAKDIVEIRKQYASGGTSYYKLATKYDVSFGHIRNIVKRKCWSWLE